MSEKRIRLIDLVMARLREERHEYDVSSVYRGYDHHGTNYELYSFYFNHVPLGEVTDTEVTMWIPPDDPHEVPIMVKYNAADPKFFQHVCGTVKLILQRHQEAADDALRGAQYFKK